MRVLNLGEVANLEASTYLTLEIRPASCSIATFLHASVTEYEDETITIDTNIGMLVLKEKEYGRQWRVRMADPQPSELREGWIS